MTPRQPLKRQKTAFNEPKAINAISTISGTRWVVTAAINHKWTDTTLINPYDKNKSFLNKCVQ